MSNVDKQIDELGYSEKATDLMVCYIVYENKEQDTEVSISWNEEDEFCHVHARSITKEKDWFGQLYDEPRALSYTEIKTFMAKIDEMRGRL